MLAMDPFAGMPEFAAVVEAGSFTAAASALRTAKSSLSDAVRGLEERLGVRLLERTTRQVRPTEAGLVFYARCRRALDEAAAGRTETQALAAGPLGRLRVAAPEGFCRRYLVPGLAGFLAAYPSIEVEVQEEAAAVRLVEKGLDLAIRIAPALEPGLVARRLATSLVVIVAAPSYLAAHGAPAQPDEVARHRCVGFSPLAWRDTWRFVAAGQELAVRVRPRLLTNSTESLVAAALAGIGLVAVPEWAVADALAAGSLARVLADFPAPPSTIYAVYPSNRLIPPKVRAFVEYVQRELKARGLG
jgi:DNA-binding transcriptional LysR family regulator